LLLSHDPREAPPTFPPRTSIARRCWISSSTRSTLLTTSSETIWSTHDIQRPGEFGPLHQVGVIIQLGFRTSFHLPTSPPTLPAMTSASTWMCEMMDSGTRVTRTILHHHEREQCDSCHQETRRLPRTTTDVLLRGRQRLLHGRRLVQDVVVVQVQQADERVARLSGHFLRDHAFLSAAAAAPVSMRSHTPSSPVNERTGTSWGAM